MGCANSKSSKESKVQTPDKVPELKSNNSKTAQNTQEPTSPVNPDGISIFVSLLTFL